VTGYDALKDFTVTLNRFPLLSILAQINTSQDSPRIFNPYLIVTNSEYMGTDI